VKKGKAQHLYCAT